MYDVKPEEFIEALAEELKSFKEIKAPVWAAFVKTGVFKERPPVKEDWWYMRVAAVLRSVAKLGPVGTAKLRKKYGGRKNRGVKPEHFFRGSGSILRKSLQQLEAAGFVKQEEKGVHKGRVITPKAASLMDKLAAKMINVNKTNKKEKVQAEPVKEKKVSPSKKEKKAPSDKKNVDSSTEKETPVKKEEQDGKVHTSKQEEKTN